MVFSNLWILNKDIKKKKLYSNKKLPRGNIYNNLIKDYNVGILTTVIRKDFYSKLEKKFDERFSIIGDFDLFLRLSKLCGFESIQKPLACYRLHGGNLSIIRKEKEIEELMIWLSENECNLNASDIKNIHIDNNRRGPANTFLKRPEIKIFDLPDDLFSFSLPSSIPSWSINEVFLDVESEIKYSGYIKRHRDEIEKQKKNESLKIWNNFEYSNLPGLSLEAREKLTNVRPETLGQAMRVSGITPADISVLMVHIFR